MNVRQLIAELSNFDPNALVIMSSDSEGNHFNPVYEIGDSKYAPYDEWSGEVIHPDDEDEYDPSDITDAVVLWPV